MSAAVLTMPKRYSANMGEIIVLTGHQIGQAILGSCLGIALYDSRHRLGALAHVVLPRAEGRSGPVGKYVDSAVPWMIETLRAKGANTNRLVCKLVGGANMFDSNGPIQIGQQNIVVAQRELENAGICIVAEHLGGNHGRRVTMENFTGRILVEIAGQSAATL